MFQDNDVAGSILPVSFSLPAYTPAAYPTRMLHWAAVMAAIESFRGLHQDIYLALIAHQLPAFTRASKTLLSLYSPSSLCGYVQALVDAGLLDATGHLRPDYQMLAASSIRYTTESQSWSLEPPLTYPAYLPQHNGATRGPQLAPRQAEPPTSQTTATPIKASL